MWNKTLCLACVLLMATRAVGGPAPQLEPWPAEAEGHAVNLSDLSGAFREDLSGAVWNPQTRTLWICRNGRGSGSRLWALTEDERGELRIGVDSHGLREWTGLGDCEGVTQADFREEVVFLIVEGEEQIRELDVSTSGETLIRQVYDTSPWLPLSGSDGAEGITFVPDEHLDEAGFTDSTGAPRRSKFGMGGLMLVGHQNGGGVFAFDLDRETGEVEFVGEFRVVIEGQDSLSAVVALEFDRSTGTLYVWHGFSDSNVLSLVKLTSTELPGKSYRKLRLVGSYEGPSDRNYEGMALSVNQNYAPKGRELFLTIDDGKKHSLLRYNNFAIGVGNAQVGTDLSFVAAVEKQAFVAPKATISEEAKPWMMLFSILGGLGIFLLGMKHLSEGMQATAGNRLRSMLNALTDNRFLAVGVGAGVTTLVQSSSITTVIVVGFVNSGLMTLHQAIGVIMGANVGTTITGWILVLQIGKYGLPILGGSAFFHLFAKKERWRHIATSIMGLGMIFFGLELMKNGVKPIRSIPEFHAAFAWFTADTYLGLMKCAALGCLLTFLVQSSSATLAITISLAVTGTISFKTAAALVLGENVGTTITAWLASIGATTSAKRAAYAHVVFNLVGVFWITLVFEEYLGLVSRFVSWESGVDILGEDFLLENSSIAYGATVTFAIAAVHTGFNVTNTALFVGFLNPFARLLERWVPGKANGKSSKLSLDNGAIFSPVLLVKNSHEAILSAANEVQEMLEITRGLLESEKPDETLVSSVFECEVMMDEFQAEVIEFLTNLLTAETSYEVAREARQQLRIVDEYESVSDYVSGILKAKLRLQEHSLALEPRELEGVLGLHDRVARYTQMITSGFQNPDARDLAEASAGSEAISQEIKKLRSRHLTSLSTSKVNPIQSMAFTTFLNGYRKVKDHALNIAESLATV